jgi:hypothetical protein
MSDETAPWWIDASETVAVMAYVRDHCRESLSCTHGRGFTYDFCPIDNGNLQAAIDHLQAQKQ